MISIYVFASSHMLINALIFSDVKRGRKKNLNETVLVYEWPQSRRKHRGIWEAVWLSSHAAPSPSLTEAGPTGGALTES